MRADWLYNADEVDAMPAHCARPRGNAVARRLSSACFLLRRKRDGRFIASLHRGLEGTYLLRPLQEGRGSESAGLRQVLACLGLRPRGTLRQRRPSPLRQLPRHHTALPPARPALYRLFEDLIRLGIDPLDYAARSGLPLMPEPPRLRCAGRDRYARPLWLSPGACEAWQRMRRAASEDGIRLDAISGFRGFDYQRGIIERKLQRGLTLPQILAVNAAPGFSEHHTGEALDIGTPGEPAAEESFERTPAFAWLQQHASTYGFRMSYPRDNPHGIVYEPWHWRHVG